MAEALGPGIARPSLASGPYACSTYYLQVTTYYLLPTNYYLLHMRGMRVSRVRIVPAGEYTEAPSVSACLATMRAQGWAFCKRQVLEYQIHKFRDLSLSIQGARGVCVNWKVQTTFPKQGGRGVPTFG